MIPSVKPTSEWYQINTRNPKVFNITRVHPVVLIEFRVAHC